MKDNDRTTPADPNRVPLTALVRQDKPLAHRAASKVQRKVPTAAFQSSV